MICQSRQSVEQNKDTIAQHVFVRFFLRGWRSHSVVMHDGRYAKAPSWSTRRHQHDIECRALNWRNSCWQLLLLCPKLPQKSGVFQWRYRPQLLISWVLALATNSKNIARIVNSTFFIFWLSHLTRPFLHMHWSAVFPSQRLLRLGNMSIFTFISLVFLLPCKVTNKFRDIQLFRQLFSKIHHYFTMEKT